MSCKTCKDHNCVCNDRVLSVTIGVPGPPGDNAGVGNISGWKVIEYQYANPYISEVSFGNTGTLVQYNIPKINLTDKYDQVRITCELDTKQRIDSKYLQARESYPDGLTILDSNGNPVFRDTLQGSAWIEIGNAPIVYAGTQQVMDFNTSTAILNLSTGVYYHTIIHLTRLTNTTMAMDYLQERNYAGGGNPRKRFTLPCTVWQTGGAVLNSLTVPDLNTNDLQFSIKADNTGNIGSITFKRLIVEAKNNF